MNLRKPDPEKLRDFRILLKAAFDAVAAEPVPEPSNLSNRTLSHPRTSNSRTWMTP